MQSLHATRYKTLLRTPCTRRMATSNFRALAPNVASFKRPRPVGNQNCTCAPPHIIGPGRPCSRRSRTLSILAPMHLSWAYSPRDTQRTPHLLNFQAKRLAWIQPAPHPLDVEASVMSSAWTGFSLAAAAAFAMAAPSRASSDSAEGESRHKSSISASAACAKQSRSAS